MFLGRYFAIEAKFCSKCRARRYPMLSPPTLWEERVEPLDDAGCLPVSMIGAAHHRPA